MTAFIALGGILIAVGVFFLTTVSQNYPALIWQTYDGQLESLVTAVDYNIDNLIKTMQHDLPYVITRREFAEAEQRWRDSGDETALVAALAQSDVAHSATTADILAMQDGKILFSTSGYTDYMFLGDYGGAFQTCSNQDGKVYFMHVTESAHNDVQYAVLTDVDTFFAHLSGKLDANMHLTLIDADGHIIIHNHGSRICVHYRGNNISIRYFRDSAFAFCDADGLALALEAQQMQQTVARTYRYEGRDADEAYQCRMLTVPTDELVNGTFLIGASLNMSNVLDQVQAISTRNTMFACFVIVGVFLWVTALLVFRQTDRRNREELALLKEKNAAADKLLAKNQELAHHQRLETIGMLTAGVAHEFNNLLTPIMSYSIMSLPRVPPEDAELTDNLVAIYDASKKARDIVARLCFLSRPNPQNGAARLSPDAVVMRVVTMTKPSAPKNVTVVLDLHCPSLCLVCSEVQLTQILTNLVMNAFEATQGMKATVHLTTQRMQDAVVFCVRDTGPGIAQDALPHIFEPFFTTKGSGKGTGLGLAIVAQAVDSCGGTIRVESAPGQGSAFTVTLPADRSQTQEE